jgi:hypothetical protein
VLPHMGFQDKIQQQCGRHRTCLWLVWLGAAWGVTVWLHVAAAGRWVVLFCGHCACAGMHCWLYGCSGVALGVLVWCMRGTRPVEASPLHGLLPG